MNKRTLLATFLALVLTCSMCVPVFAATGARSIVIRGTKTVYVGDTIELDSEIYPGYVDVSDWNIVWKSSNSKVAKVLRKRNEDTLIRGKKKGTVTITVQISGTNIKDTYKIKVKKAKKSNKGVTSAKKKITSYKNSAKAIRADISKVKLAGTMPERRTQYMQFVGKIESIDRKLDRLGDTWESKFEFGKTTYKNYRTIERKIDAAENYLESVEDYLNQKFMYEFDD